MKKWSHNLFYGAILCVLVLFTVSPAVRADNFTWTLRTTPTGAIWQAVAASSDCQKIAIGGENTYIYTSTNGGISWTQRTGSGNRNWYGLASTADGTMLAAVTYNGYIYTSTDGGANWTEQTGSGSRYWKRIASSSNGSKLVATSDSIYISTDSGATWTACTSAGSGSWEGIAISPDGTKIAAVDAGSYVYTSSNGGTTWTTRSSVGSQSWMPLAASSDNKTIIVGAWGGYVKSSSDSGNTWTQHNSVGSAFWWGAACSADGNVMGMAQNSPNGYVWTTTDGGSTWSAETSAGSRTWWDVVSSSDGTRLVASYSGYVYVGTTTPSAPTVTTATISSISSTTASGGGNVTDDGWATVTARGVCWSTSADPDTGDSKTSDSSGTGTFTSSITSLSPGTLYHVRAYATNSVGTSYGDDSTFTTLTTTPTVTTATITSITSTTASSGGAIPDSGGATITAKGVCWDTSANPTTAHSHTTDGTGAASFTSSLTSLSPATLYHVRAYATNSVGTSYGDDSSFTTLTTPTVTTATITSITSTTASSGGAIPDSGGATITAKGVCWNTSGTPTTDDDTTNNGTGAASFASSITGLASHTTYHVRAYATNSEGTSYGDELDFTTLTTPTVTTTAITAITSTTASSGGAIPDSGGATITAKGVCWDTSANPTTAHSHTTDGTGAASFTSSLTSLSPATLYHVRAYATNSVGTSYGDDSSFITLQTFTISGYVLNSDSVGVSGVVMSGLPDNPQTDEDGSYSGTVDYGWSGTVTPTDSSCIFQPESTSYDAVVSNQTDQNYVIYCLSEGVDEDKDKMVPRDYLLSQNYPNPFNPSTEIAFGLPKAVFVTLKVFNILGQKVITLVDKNLPAGTYRVRWDGTDGSGRSVSSGVYFYRIQAGDYLHTKRMLFLK